MKAVITGITGFVGSHLADQLLARGDDILGIVRSSRSVDRNELQRRIVSGINFSFWDLRQRIPPQTVNALTNFKPDVVFHLAAMSIPSDCGKESPTDLAIQVNTTATEQLAQLLLSLPNNPRLFFASSSHVYGDVSDPGTLIDETAEVCPRRGYGKTKLQAEQLLNHSVLNGLDAVIARSFQHTGPRQVPRMMLPEWIQQIIDPAQRPVQVITMESFMDICDVRDVTRAYQKIAENGKSGEIYNVGSGKVTCARDIWSIIENEVGESIDYHELTGEQHVHPIADVTKIKQSLGWEVEIPLSQTVRDTLDYWQQLTLRQIIEP